jgi:hypothetical protein
MAEAVQVRAVVNNHTVRTVAASIVADFSSSIARASAVHAPDLRLSSSHADRLTLRLWRHRGGRAITALRNANAGVPGPAWCGNAPQAAARPKAGERGRQAVQD